MLYVLTRDLWMLSYEIFILLIFVVTFGWIINILLKNTQGNA